MRPFVLIALACLGWLAVLGAVNVDASQIWRVPGDFGTVPEAIASAQPGDTIEIDMGHYKIAGRGYSLPPGLTIRGIGGVVGSVVLSESARFPGDWRDAPVFVLDQPGEPCRFEGISFRDWNLGDGPYQFISNPIFHVLEGTLEFVDCEFRDFYKHALYFSGGDGLLDGCRFAHGRGCPSAVSFGGGELVVRDSWFHHNSWIHDCGEYRGSIIHLRSGQTSLIDSHFEDNGPLVRIIRIDRPAELNAEATCLVRNASMWEGRVAGSAYLDCCEICPSMWQVVDGGELVIIDPLDKAMARESASWSQVKSLFD
ncbi:hypothetical protein GF314_14135 [bacterium]|nr:hypothetical protein [bacterium]